MHLRKKLFIFILVLLMLPVCVLATPMTEPGGILCLVNREVSLEKEFEPEVLVKPDVRTRKESLQERIFMTEEAARALENLFGAALTEKGYTLLAVSGYRSYGYQQVLFNQKAQAVGRQQASLTVAKAGESEHQLGLAMDVQCADEPTLSIDFADTKEGQWVAENAHRFGFIIRYKEEWSDLTGYDYEPWHLRYIGTAHATAVYMLNIPFETYFEQLIKLPDYVIEHGNPYLLAGAIGDLVEGKPEILSLLPANPKNIQNTLSQASEMYLPDDMEYQQAVWLGYPTPAPTPAPRIDEDTEEVTYGDM